MEIEHALLADYAAQTNDGKLMVAGIFSTLVVPQFPGQHPHMALALRIHVHPGEASQQEFKLRLVDPDGKPLVELGGTFKVERMGLDEGAHPQLVVDLNNLVFPGEGPYSFDVFINGRLERRVPLRVKKQPEATRNATTGG